MPAKAPQGHGIGHLAGPHCLSVTVSGSLAAVETTRSITAVCNCNRMCGNDEQNGNHDVPPGTLPTQLSLPTFKKHITLALFCFVFNL